MSGGGGRVRENEWGRERGGEARKKGRARPETNKANKGKGSELKKKKEKRKKKRKEKSTKEKQKGFNKQTRIDVLLLYLTTCRLFTCLLPSSPPPLSPEGSFLFFSILPIW